MDMKARLKNFSENVIHMKMADKQDLLEALELELEKAEDTGLEFYMNLTRKKLEILEDSIIGPRN